MAIWHEDRLLIDGELVAADGGRTYDTVNPATDDVLGTSADATAEDARRAVAGHPPGVVVGRVHRLANLVRVAVQVQRQVLVAEILLHHRLPLYPAQSHTQ